MALIKSVRGFTPEIGENCFLADNATIIGDVKIGNDCSIWFITVFSGDVNSIRLGKGVNIQEACQVGDYGSYYRLTHTAPASAHTPA